MRRTNGFGTLMSIALAGAVLGAPGEASAADRLEIHLGMTGDKAAAGLKGKAEDQTRKTLHGRQGTLNGRKLSTEADGPEVVKITITIEGKDDDDEDEDADMYNVHLQLSDDHEPFKIDELDTSEDPDGTEMLKHLDHVLTVVMEELTKRNE
ncbi:MAG TPA: hypothetical protein VFK05_29420 [Polyangiaceae bacterium]|nr:hypothetical protein [Polyangiaceae bacterium]